MIWLIESPEVVPRMRLQPLILRGDPIKGANVARKVQLRIRPVSR
jgi:hypothetical protein